MLFLFVLYIVIQILLATTSTDGKCRIFSTFIKGVDSRNSGTSASSDAKFGEQIVQLDICFSWAFGVKWSPSGNAIAYVGHNSMIYFVDDVGPSPLVQTVAFRDLPLRDVLFLSERMLIGVGFDCNPMVFTADEIGLWSFVKFLDERKTAPSSSKYGSQFSEAFGKFYGQSKQNFSNDSVEPSRPRGGVHENFINSITPLKKVGDGIVKRFSTSGLDGKVVIWDLENQADLSVRDVTDRNLQAGAEYYILPVVPGRAGGLTGGSPKNGTCPLDVVKNSMKYQMLKDFDEPTQQWYVTMGGVEGNPGVCDFCKVICRDIGIFIDDNGVRCLALSDEPFKIMFKK
ncbi:hypothetical protein GIB67_012313, partial [Kingdonia uniflora]